MLATHEITCMNGAFVISPQILLLIRLIAQDINLSERAMQQVVEVAETASSDAAA